MNWVERNRRLNLLDKGAQNAQTPPLDLREVHPKRYPRLDAIAEGLLRAIFTLQKQNAEKDQVIAHLREEARMLREQRDSWASIGWAQEEEALLRLIETVKEEVEG